MKVFDYVCWNFVFQAKLQQLTQRCQTLTAGVTERMKKEIGYTLIVILKVSYLIWI